MQYSVSETVLHPLQRPIRRPNYVIIFFSLHFPQYFLFYLNSLAVLLLLYPITAFSLSEMIAAARITVQ